MTAIVPSNMLCTGSYFVFQGENVTYIQGLQMKNRLLANTCIYIDISYLFINVLNK